MSDHLATVHLERAKYPPPQYGADGKVLNPIGIEAAWTISNATAWTWRGEGWGLLAKTSGANWDGYSADVLVNVREHQAVDCLGDSEGAGRPQWSVLAWEDRFVGLWRPPVEPADPEPPTTDLETRVTRLEASVGVLESAIRDAADALGRV